MKFNALYSYNQGSVSGAALADGLDIPRIKHRNSAFKGSENKTIINWGSSNLPEEVAKCVVLNLPGAINRASNKLETFRKFHVEGISCPKWFISRETAIGYVSAGKTVFARTILQGHSGAGIVIMDPEDPATWDVQAPLYTVYYKKKNEYRIHVVADKAIDVQRKGLSAEFRGRADINWKIRNLKNGFIYAREGIEVPDSAKELAVSAVRALGLHFGAVDIIECTEDKTFRVLEVNTAPGITGTTLENYISAFSNLEAN